MSAKSTNNIKMARWKSTTMLRMYCSQRKKKLRSSIITKRALQTCIPARVWEWNIIKRKSFMRRNRSATVLTGPNLKNESVSLENISLNNWNMGKATRIRWPQELRVGRWRSAEIFRETRIRFLQLLFEYTQFLFRTFTSTNSRFCQSRGPEATDWGEARKSKQSNLSYFFTHSHQGAESWLFFVLHFYVVYNILSNDWKRFLPDWSCFQTIMS